jgi:hypothetical protein
MKTSRHSQKGRIETIKTLFILLIAFSSLSLFAQTPTDFSGKWEFDKARSDKSDRGDASFDGKIIMEIVQNSETFAFINTFFIPGRDAMITNPHKFLIDGTVEPDNTGTDPAKKFLTWSQDKKTVTASYVMTATIDGVAQDFLTAWTYTLTDGGKTLVVEEVRRSILNGERIIKKIYKKI